MNRTGSVVKVKVNITLEQAMKIQKWDGGNIKLYSIFNLGARWCGVVKSTSRPLYPRE
jgi:hypothetical protein